MRNLRFVGLCVVAALALAAVSAASASAAEPAAWQCGAAAKVGKTYVGHYTSKTCTAASKVETGGKYELEEWNIGSKASKTGKEGKTKAFKGKGGGANLEIQGVGGLTCTKSADTGEFTGPTTVGKIHVTFSGCLLHSHPCESTSPKASKSGEVITKPLKGVVGFISKAKEEVGIELSAEETYEAEVNCGELKLRVDGSVIGLVKPPYNHFTKELTLVFNQSGGIQNPEKFEEGPVATLTTEIGSIFGSEYGEKDRSAESTETTNKGEELELKA